MRLIRTHGRMCVPDYQQSSFDSQNAMTYSIDMRGQGEDKNLKSSEHERTYSVFQKILGCTKGDIFFQKQLSLKRRGHIPCSAKIEWFKVYCIDKNYREDLKKIYLDKLVQKLKVLSTYIFQKNTHLYFI